ncbi:hypothetical protein L1049_011463 [Liquidambar formosana]|uniref:GDSL esterase/lipase n=1 Tax=Liquidambar formosana TaxID=63359 RepID=A0AAP0RRC8_LIQFO
MSTRTVAIFFTFFSLSSLLSLPLLTTANPSTTAIYAFGDSLADSGNNNHIPTLFRSDHPPYGRDFPGHVPSGRFSDGKLATDFLASSLGIKELLPAYLDPLVTDHELLTGVSFASAGSGLDDQTAALTNVLNLKTQLGYFEEAMQRMRRTVAGGNVSEIVEKALFLVAAGTNDMLYNFYDLPLASLRYSLSRYHDLLLQNLQSVIQRLYNMGARKFAVTGLPPIGCMPVQVTMGSLIPSQNMLERVCIDQQNHDSQAYNAKLQSLLSRLPPTLPGARLAYLDTYNPMMDMITNPAKYGFQQTLEGCCGFGGFVEMGPLCNEIDPTCPDPSRYLFWDAAHPTQATYSILANLYGQTVLPQVVG